MTSEPKMRIDIGRGTLPFQMRAVYLGRVERLADVFTFVTRREYLDGTRTISTYHGAHCEGCEITDYASAELKGGPRVPFLRVEPSPEVIAVIDQHMIHPEFDRISFKIIEWDNGDALVTADNSKIIGGAWLAFLAPAAVAELRAALAIV